MTNFELNSDLQIGSVFETNGTSIKVSLRRNLTELSQSHGGTVYSIGQIGSLIKLHMGRTIIFAMVRMLRLQTDEELAALSSSDTIDRRVLEADLFGEARWISSEGRLNFDRGVRTYPLPLQPVFLVTTSESKELYTAIEKNGSDEANKFISFGCYVGADGIACHADMDKLFGHHLAVLGSTGSGKSTAVAAVLHAIIAHKPKFESTCSPYVVIIDPHNEYGSAFGKDAVVFKAYQDVGELGQHIKLPYWLMSNDELRQLFIGKSQFEATSQANIVSKALAHARMHYAGLVKSAVDSLAAAAATPQIPPDAPRALDPKHEAAIGTFDRDKPLPFCLNEFEAHIRDCQAKKLTSKGWEDLTPSEFNKEFASIFDKIRVLRGDNRISFLMKNYEAGDPGLDELIGQFLAASADGSAAPIRILDIAGLSNEVAGPLTAMVARLLFSYKLHQTGEERKKDPILLVCEEAHRYVPDRGEAQYASAQGAIRRIAREGRKYGIGLMLVSQRPADVESTVLSQCNSWLVLRLSNRADQTHVSKFLPDTLAGLTKLLPSLPRREALFIGEAAALPARIRIQNIEEHKRPKSEDVSFAKGWSNPHNSVANIRPIAERMSGKVGN